MTTPRECYVGFSAPKSVMVGCLTLQMHVNQKTHDVLCFIVIVLFSTEQLNVCSLQVNEIQRDDLCMVVCVCE